MSTNAALLAQEKINSETLEILLESRKNGEVDFVLIDIREPYEYKERHIVGVDYLLPTTQLQAWAGLLTDRFGDRPIVLTCRTSNRTGQVQQILHEHLGMDNIVDHVGGIVTYHGAVESGMEGARGV